MSTFFEKLVAAVRFLGHYLWIALKALGRFLLWLGALLVRSLSNLITWIRLNLPPRVQFILLAVVVAILIVLVALVFTGHACTFAPDSEEPAEEQPPEITYTPDESDYRHIAIQPDTITSFSLVESGNQMYASLSEDENRSITEDLSWLEADNEDVGFLIMNLNTGSGFCYNIDTRIYGASTYKAPISAFLCEEYIDGGTLNKSAVSNRIEDAIVWSDNNSYRSLKHSYDGSDHNNWLSEMGIDPANYMATFPSYSVRDSATLWTHIWDYLNSGSDTATWLKGLFERTETSFLRNGAVEAGMDNATVYNKAGWCVSESGREDAVNDAGIVVDGDNTYLVVAFTSRPDSPTAEANLSALFASLLKARHSLDASSATWDNVEVVEAPAEGEGDTGVELAVDSPDEGSTTAVVKSGASQGDSTIVYASDTLLIAKAPRQYAIAEWR